MGSPKKQTVAHVSQSYEVQAELTSNYLSGMFLYARLVLDYLATNIFFSGEEVKTSIGHLPDKLSDLYANYYLLMSL